MDIEQYLFKDDFFLATLLKCFCLYCRDAVSDLALHFLNKMKILVVRDIERDEIEFICKVVYRSLVCFYTLYTLQLQQIQFNV